MVRATLMRTAAAKYARALKADKMWLLFGDAVMRGSTMVEPDIPPDTRPSRRRPPQAPESCYQAR